MFAIKKATKQTFIWKWQNRIITNNEYVVDCFSSIPGQRIAMFWPQICTLLMSKLSFSIVVVVIRCSNKIPASNICITEVMCVIGTFFFFHFLSDRALNLYSTHFRSDNLFSLLLLYRKVFIVLTVVVFIFLRDDWNKPNIYYFCMQMLAK